MTNHETVFVSMLGEFPVGVTTDLSTAQERALTRQTEFQSAGKYEHRWDDKQRPGEVWRLMERRTTKGTRFSWTGRSVHALPAAAVSVPPPATRADALRWAADRLAEEIQRGARFSHEDARHAGLCESVMLLRRMADEAQQPEPEAEPTAEEIARANVLALHQIGEQLAGIESWMWEHLADVREAAKAQSAVSGPCVAGEQQNETPEGEPGCAHCGGDHSWDDCEAYTALVAAEAPHTETPEAEVVHGCPPPGSGLTPCCGRTPFELPLTDRISSEAPVTCPGKEA